MTIDVRDKVVVLTGRFSIMTRRQASTALEARGATIGRSVSSSTQILFAGERAGSKRAKAERLGIPIYSEAELVALLRGAAPDPTPAVAAVPAERDIADGQVVEVQGSARRPYQLKNIGGVYSCSCPAWRNQSHPIERRTCKHLISVRGRAAEEARVGDALAQPPVRSSTAEAPGLLLAQRWEPHVDPAGWWMSEKLDGVRAYWDGRQFLSRQGNRYMAPDWFVADLPETPLDGELWLARGAFQRTISIVRRHDASEHWREIRFLVFDAPTVPGDFEARTAQLATLLPSAASHVSAVVQTRCRDEAHLREELARVEALSGEGLMLRQPGSAYIRGRSHTLLKVKSFHDAEARVIGYRAGAGRHKGRVGALVVVRPDGAEFAVGTGLSDAQRESPPAIGSVITYRYQELTDGGIPRFPSFLRVRAPADPGAPAAEPDGG